MKKHLKTKILVTPVLLTCILTPILMSSCASVSQYYLPIVIGGAGNGPYQGLKDSSKMNAPDNLDNIDMNIGHDYAYNSYQSPDYNYLPDSYISYTSRSKTGSDSYGWTNPFNTSSSWSDPNVPNPTYYQYGWYNASNSKLGFQNNKDINKKSETFMTSVQNWNTATAIQANTAIAAATGYLSNGLTNFMGQPGIVKNSKSVTYYDALFNPQFAPSTPASGLDHGDKDGANDQQKNDNRNFYEYLFDEADLLGQGKTKFKFSESAAQFQYSSWNYGPGPYVASTNEITGSGGEFGSQWQGLTNNPNLIPQDFVDNGAINPDLWNVNGGALGTMIAHTTFTSDADDFTKPFHVSGFGASIPFLIQPGDNQHSFYNPLKNLSINPNDYLLNDIASLNKEIKKSNAWKTFPNFVGPTYDKNKWASTLSWNTNTSATYNTASFNGSNGILANLTDKNKLLTAADAAADAAKAADTSNPTICKAQNVDPSIIRLLGDNTFRSELKPNTYIGFANYSFISYPKDDGGTTTYSYFPVFAGIQTASNGLPAIFPLELLTTIDQQKWTGNVPSWDGNTELEVDGGMFTASPIPELLAIYNNAKLNSTLNVDIKSVEYNKKKYDIGGTNANLYYLNIDKLAEKEASWLSFINQSDTKHKIKSTTTWDKLNGQQKTYLTMMSVLFGNYNEAASSWSIVKSSQFLTSVRNEQ